MNVGQTRIRHLQGIFTLVRLFLDAHHSHHCTLVLNILHSCAPLQWRGCLFRRLIISRQQLCYNSDEKFELITRCKKLFWLEREGCTSGEEENSKIPTFPEPEHVAATEICTWKQASLEGGNVRNSSWKVQIGVCVVLLVVYGFGRKGYVLHYFLFYGLICCIFTKYCEC